MPLGSRLCFYEPKRVCVQCNECLNRISNFLCIHSMMIYYMWPCEIVHYMNSACDSQILKLHFLLGFALIWCISVCLTGDGGSCGGGGLRRVNTCASVHFKRTDMNCSNERVHWLLFDAFELITYVIYFSFRFFLEHRARRMTHKTIEGKCPSMLELNVNAMKMGGGGNTGRNWSSLIVAGDASGAELCTVGNELMIFNLFSFLI